MNQRHFNIPIFIPELACPQRCVFCSQSQISSTKLIPDEQNVIEIIETYLATLPLDANIQIAFFGGNFTGISKVEQHKYLRIAQRYVDQGKAKSIRLSTRPDYINTEVN